MDVRVVAMHIEYGPPPPMMEYIGAVITFCGDSNFHKHVNTLFTLTEYLRREAIACKTVVVYATHLHIICILMKEKVGSRPIYQTNARFSRVRDLNVVARLRHRQLL